MNLPEYVTMLLKKLNDAGFEAYVVGGAVRDSLRGEIPHDYDITTNALPDQMKQVFHDFHLIETGIQHGTVTVMVNHKPVEITTYRKDSPYQDHRHPDHVEFTSALKEDCQRRDFTINAMCYHPDQGFVDFFGGKEDLKKGIIRCIGDPEKRFEEDALRILRALRFAARFSFAIDPDTARVLLEKKDTLSYVSMERINEEFTGILKSKGCADILEDYREVIEVFLPEIKTIRDDNWKQLHQRLDEETTKRADIRMSLILYALQDRMQARKVLKRMKYSNHFIATCTDLLNTADDPATSDIQFRQVLGRMQTDTDTWFAFQKALHPEMSLAEKKQQYARLTNDAYCWKLSQLHITGKDLIKIGIKGIAIGDTLRILLEKVMHEEIPNEKGILLQEAQKYHSQQK